MANTTNELYNKWQETKEKRRKCHDVLSKLEDISTFGGYKITFTKSNRGTAKPVEVDVYANTYHELSAAREIMATALSVYHELLKNYDKDLDEIDKQFNSPNTPSL